MSLAGVVIAFWGLTQDVAGSSPFVVMINIFYPANSVKHLGKTPLSKTGMC